MAPWPIEAGPEFVHGRNSIFVRFVEQHLGVRFVEKDWPDWWYFGRQVGGQGLVNDQDVDQEVDKVCTKAVLRVLPDKQRCGCDALKERE